MTTPSASSRQDLVATLKAADWLIECLWRCHRGQPVRGLDEAAEGYRHARAALASEPEPQPVAEGWVLVPREPTEAMIAAPLAEGSSITGARYESRRDLRPLIYRAMLSASPHLAEEPKP